MVIYEQLKAEIDKARKNLYKLRDNGASTDEIYEASVELDLAISKYETWLKENNC